MPRASQDSLLQLGRNPGVLPYFLLPCQSLPEVARLSREGLSTPVASVTDWCKFLIVHP